MLTKRPTQHQLLHIGMNGNPMCGAISVGALLVEPQYVTCPFCREVIRRQAHLPAQA